MPSGDTIAAISSAVGPAARMIVRLTGDRAADITRTLAPAAALEHATVSREIIEFAGLHVPAWIYAFHAPRSYTGETSVEFHLPGNPLLARMLLDACMRHGARFAEPGEFTARAFFNGRIDLAAAEGVAATIAAQNEAELDAARQLLAGELSRRLRPAMNLIAETLALVETGIDFADEDVTVITAADARQRIDRTDALLADLVASSARFERLTHEPHVVLVGRPNAGKSTLLNALAGRERAVVSPVAGTTRDVVSADVKLRRGIIKLLDAAGLQDDRQASEASDIDHQMRGRALRAIETSDHVILVRDATDPCGPAQLPRHADFTVLTKSDLLPARGVVTSGDHVLVSAHTRSGFDQLLARLDDLAFGESSSSRPSLALNARHLHAIEDARSALARARQNVNGASELLAFDLRVGLDALGSVLGMVSPDDVLGRIFSAFCIGK